MFCLSRCDGKGKHFFAFGMSFATSFNQSSIVRLNGEFSEGVAAEFMLAVANFTNYAGLAGRSHRH